MTAELIPHTVGKRYLPTLDEIRQIETNFILDDKGCHLYTGSVDSATQRARINIRTIQYPVARLVAILHSKLSFEDIHNWDKPVCHKCDNPRCIKNDCLYVGTTSSNALDIWKGKCKKGHDLTHGDVYIGKEGRRHCRQCVIERSVVNRRIRNARKKSGQR